MKLIAKKLSQFIYFSYLCNVNDEDEHGTAKRPTKHA